MGGEHDISFQVLADNIFHEDFTVRLASVKKLKHLIIGNKRHKSDLVQIGVVPRLVRLLSEPGLSQDLLCEAITALGSFAHGTRLSIEAVVSAEAVPSLSRGLLHPSSSVVLCCLRTLSTLYSCNLHTLNSDLIFYDSQVVSRLVSLLEEPHPLGQRAAVLLARACQTLEQQSLLCEYQALQKLSANLLSPVNKMVAASLLCMASIVYENPVAANLLASLECRGEPLVCLVVKILSNNRDTNTKMAAAKCLSFLHRCRGIGDSSHFQSDMVAMDTSQSGKGSSIPLSQSAYGMDNFQSGVSLKVLPALARFTRQDNDIPLRTEAISTLAYLTEQELPLQELAADSEKLVPCVASYLTTPPPDPESEVVLPDHLLLWQRLRGACLLLLASLASSREELRCKVGGQRGVVEHLAKALEDENGDVRGAALKCLLSLSRSTKLLRTTLYDHTCWKHVVDMLSHDPTEDHTYVRACLRGASAVACNLLLPFSPCREVMIEVGVVSKLVALTDHEDEVIKVNSIWALMSTADSSSTEVRQQVVSSLTFHRLLRFLSPSSSPILLRKSLGLLVNLTQGHEKSSDIGEKLLTQEEGGDILSAVEDLMEGAWPEDQVEQCLCLLVNLSGCGSRAKDMLTGRERLVKVLCTILRTSASVSVVMAVVDIVRNLAAVECDSHVHRQNCLKEFGANTALQKLEIKFEHKRLQLHIQDALEQFSA